MNKLDKLELKILQVRLSKLLGGKVEIISGWPTSNLDFTVSSDYSLVFTSRAQRMRAIQKLKKLLSPICQRQLEDAFSFIPIKKQNAVWLGSTEFNQLVGELTRKHK